MVKLSVCIEPFFSWLPYADRIRKVAELGFTTYEFWFHDRRYDGKGLVPEEKDFRQIAELNAKYGLTTAALVFNHPDGGIRASLVQRKDRGMLLDSIEGMCQAARRRARLPPWRRRRASAPARRREKLSGRRASA